MTLSLLPSLWGQNLYYYDINTLLRLVGDVKLLNGVGSQSHVLRRETCLNLDALLC